MLRAGQGEHHDGRRRHAAHRRRRRRRVGRLLQDARYRWRSRRCSDAALAEPSSNGRTPPRCQAMAAYAAWIKTLKPQRHVRDRRRRLPQAPALRRRARHAARPIPRRRRTARSTQTRAQFVATAKKIDPKATPAASLSVDHASAPGARRAARDGATRSASSCAPSSKRSTSLRCRRTRISRSSRRRPSSARRRAPPEDSPGPLETVATQSYYYVTPVDPTWSRQAKEEFLAQFNDFEFPIISAHEVYPGHFTNFAIDRGSTSASRASSRSARSLPKAGRTTASR